MIQGATALAVLSDVLVLSVAVCIPGGHGCTAYDIILNPQLLAQLHQRQILMGFVLTVVIEGLENKYDVSLARGEGKQRRH